MFAEAWDYNESKESLAGAIVGAHRRVWKALSVRAEGVLLRVAQAETKGWLRGFTLGTRTHFGVARIQPFMDLGVGMSDATTPIPPRGTRVNFLAVAGGGVQVHMRERISLNVSARWLHVSNNGREGHGRNPDIQALGAVIGIGWVY